MSSPDSFEKASAVHIQAQKCTITARIINNLFRNEAKAFKGNLDYVDKPAMNSTFTSAVKSLTKNGTSFGMVRIGKRI